MNNEELILQMLGKISDKLEEHDKHFESIDNHFESIDNRFESIDNRFESLETDVRHTRMLIEKQEHNVQLIAEQYGDISAKLERVREIDELRDRVRTLETVVRLTAEQLDSVQPVGVGIFEQSKGLLVVKVQGLSAGHLADGPGCTVVGHQVAAGSVCQARHRGKHRPRRDLQIA